MALASALEQKNKYDQIILARPIIPLSNREIGFLPGDAESKISPYMQPLWDNLNFIKNQFKANERKSKVLEQLQESGLLTITALAFIRGRSLINSIFIVDEAQNLTPHEVKTAVSRAGGNDATVLIEDCDVAPRQGSQPGRRLIVKGDGYPRRADPEISLPVLQD